MSPARFFRDGVLWGNHGIRWRCGVSKPGGFELSAHRFGYGDTRFTVWFWRAFAWLEVW